jgi:hypothetical protein
MTAGRYAVRVRCSKLGELHEALSRAFARPGDEVEIAAVAASATDGRLGQRGVTASSSASPIKQRS